MLTKEEIIKKNFKDVWVTEHLSDSDTNNIRKAILRCVDEYASQNAIQFAEWLNKEGYQEYDYYGHWIAPQNNNNVYNTQQVYEMFITQ